MTGSTVPERLIVPTLAESTSQGLNKKVPSPGLEREYPASLLLPLRVRQAEGVGRVDPMKTVVPVLSENVLSVTKHSRFVYCSISRPEAAFEDRF